MRICDRLEEWVGHTADGITTVDLTKAVEGWVVPGRNPFGLYLYTPDVDAIAARFTGEIVEIEAPSDKPWGMYEFALSDPDGVLVRIGWPSQSLGWRRPSQSHR